MYERLALAEMVERILEVLLLIKVGVAWTCAASMVTAFVMVCRLVMEVVGVGGGEAGGRGGGGK